MLKSDETDTGRKEFTKPARFKYQAVNLVELVCMILDCVACGTTTTHEAISENRAVRGWLFGNRKQRSRGTIDNVSRVPIEGTQTGRIVFGLCQEMVRIVGWVVARIAPVLCVSRLELAEMASAFLDMVQQAIHVTYDMHRFDDTNAELFKVLGELPVGAQIGRNTTHKDGARRKGLADSQQELASDVDVIAIVEESKVKGGEAEKVGEEEVDPQVRGRVVSRRRRIHGFCAVVGVCRVEQVSAHATDRKEHDRAKETAQAKELGPHQQELEELHLQVRRGESVLFLLYGLLPLYTYHDGI